MFQLWELTIPVRDVGGEKGSGFDWRETFFGQANTSYRFFSKVTIATSYRFFNKVTIANVGGSNLLGGNVYAQCLQKNIIST